MFKGTLEGVYYDPPLECIVLCHNQILIFSNGPAKCQIEPSEIALILHGGAGGVCARIINALILHAPEGARHFSKRNA